jgi:hypothetical protein
MNVNDIAVLMSYIKTSVLMKHKGMTTEQAKRVVEFEFELSEDGKELCGLEYWLGNGRRKTNRRTIDLSGDAEFDDLFYDAIYQSSCWPRNRSQSNAPALD